LTEEQRMKKINNLLTEMSKKDGSIKSIGSTRAAKWALNLK